LNDLSIYQEKILNLANENKRSIAIEDFNRSFEVKNPMCGDEVKVRLKLIDKQITDISAIVRGCALCEASAGLVVKLFKNNDIPNKQLTEDFENWLNNIDQPIPATLPKEMDVFKPIKEIKNRHKCITMPFEATVKSVQNDN
jgi:nitrogen fixation NifU-like protein|tara:strand:- start:361 stop:786 length:426 start_codon:yes stop_codon:yes gene_type:complete